MLYHNPHVSLLSLNTKAPGIKQKKKTLPPPFKPSADPSTMSVDTIRRAQPPLHIELKRIDKAALRLPVEDWSSV